MFCRVVNITVDLDHYHPWYVFLCCECYHGSLTFTTPWIFCFVVNVTVDLNLYLLPPLDFLLGCNLCPPILAHATDIPGNKQDPAHCISVPRILVCHPLCCCYPYHSYMYRTPNRPA